MSYPQSFQTFIESTNEKQLLREHAQKTIAEYEVDSILDIGPGNGTLSIPLSQQVDEYLGVEKKQKFVEELREAGLKIIHDTFPVDLDRKFGLVLISHSVPYEPEKYKKLLRSAYSYVLKEGVLAVITFRGKKNEDWQHIQELLGENSKALQHRRWLKQLHNFLQSLGETKVNHVETSVRCDSVDELFNALGFVFTNGKAKKLQNWKQKETKIKSYLSKHHKEERGYSVSCTHSYFTVHK